ncbi:MAG TPA: hypothetical protein VHV83_03965 [Armatimonadota bacterium]|nr:hypothetical protein [Armatimonadota bacterium]
MEQLDATKSDNTPVPAHDPLGRVLFVLAVLILALSPTQLSILPHLPLSPADLLLVVAALVWGIRWIIIRDTRSLPPFVNWLLIIAGVFSAVSLFVDTEPAQGFLGNYVKELAQLVLYLLVGVTIFRATLTSPRRIRIAIIALLATTSLAVLFGVVQRGLLARDFQPDATKRTVFMDPTPRGYITIETPIAVCSTFGSWNEKGFHASRMAYAGFLGLVLPFALVLLATAKRRLALTLWLSFLFIGAAVSVLAGYIVPAILLGLLVTGCLLGRRTAWLTVAGIAVYLFAMLLIGGQNRIQVFQEPFRLKISTIEANNPNNRYDGVRHLKKIWGEQLASLSVMRGTRYVQNPALFGVGAGQYQKNIQEGYGGLSAVSNQHLESDAQSGYLLTMVSTGIFGLAALLAIFLTYTKHAWRLARQKANHPWAAACCGAMVTLVLMTLVTNPLVRGSSVAIAALFALIGNFATLAPQARIQE